MVSIIALWLPILVSAVLVFLASFLLHMVLPLHRADYRQLPAEDDVMDALRKFAIPPGDYMVPRPAGPADMRTQAYKDKLARGPVAVMTVFPSGPFNMGESLAQWFVYLLFAGVMVAYITGRAVGADAPYLQVFRFAGATAFIAHWFAMMQDSIWYKRDWATTLRYALDGLVYAFLTAGTFGWLWPR